MTDNPNAAWDAAAIRQPNNAPPTVVALGHLAWTRYDTGVWRIGGQRGSVVFPSEGQMLDEIVRLRDALAKSEAENAALRGELTVWRTGRHDRA